MLKRQHTTWSEQDDESLRRLAPTVSLARLAIRLGRTEYAIKRRASDLRISLLTKQDFKRQLSRREANGR